MRNEKIKISVLTEPEMNSFIENYKTNYKNQTGKSINKSEVVLKFMILGIKASKNTNSLTKTEEINENSGFNSIDAQEYDSEQKENSTFAQDISEERIFSSNFAQDFSYNKKQKELKELENHLLEREKSLREQEKQLFEERIAIIEQMQNDYFSQKSSNQSKEFEKFEQKTLELLKSSITEIQKVSANLIVRTEQKVGELNANIAQVNKKISDNQIELKREFHQKNEIRVNESSEMKQQFNKLEKLLHEIWYKINTSDTEDQILKYSPIIVTILSLVLNRQNKQAIKELSDLHTELKASISEKKE